MNRDNQPELSSELLYDLSDELGVFRCMELECPGVYYYSVEPNANQTEHEYYLIERNTPHISDEAKAYGTSLSNHPEIIVVPINKDRGGGAVVRYEVFKYRLKNQLPLPDGETMLAAGIFGMEDYPEYFGSFPAPRITPRGFMTRYKELMQGVFAVETDQCEKMIAVCYPAWYDGFSPYTMHFAERNDSDREEGIDNTMGYLFFPECDACLAVFEILQRNHTILKNDLINPLALHNAIWHIHPSYAIAYNRAEQLGQHDMVGQILSSLGNEVELNMSSENLIQMTPDIGTEWLKL